MSSSRFVMLRIFVNVIIFQFDTLSPKFLSLVSPLKNTIAPTLEIGIACPHWCRFASENPVFGLFIGL